MKFIIGSRGEGNSTDLLLEASKFDDGDIIFVTKSELAIDYFQSLCRSLKISPPTFVTYEQFLEGTYACDEDTRIFIDELPVFLNYLKRYFPIRGVFQSIGVSLD